MRYKRPGFGGLRQFSTVMQLSLWLAVSATASRDVSAFADTPRVVEKFAPSAVGSRASAAPMAKQAETEAVGSSTSFRGWKGESAVMRREEILRSGKIRTEFFILRPDGSAQPLSQPQRRNGSVLPRDPPGLQEGKTLISDYQDQPGYPKLSLRIDVKKEALKALEDATGNPESGKEIPVVPAILRIEMLAGEGGRKITILEKSLKLTATADENGLVYRPPALRDAVSSPGGGMLLVHLAGSNVPEFIVLPTRSAKSR